MWRIHALLLLVLSLPASLVRADDNSLPETARIVVAIRYLQVDGTSHAHLYLYGPDGKVVRQLTNAEDGQDRDPIFAPDGKTVVFSRALKDKEESWSVAVDNGKAQRLASVPDWYFSTLKQEVRKFDFPWEPGPTDPKDMRIKGSTTAEDVHYAAPDGVSEIILKKRSEKEGDFYPKEAWLHQQDQPDVRVSDLPFTSLDQSGTAAEKAMRNAPGPNGRYDSEGTEPGIMEGVMVCQGTPFIWNPPLRVAILTQHRGSTFGDASFAVDLNTRKLYELTPTSGDVVIVPMLKGFFCVTSERYLPLGDGKRTVNCTFLDLWNAELKRIRFSAPKLAHCYGGSLWIPKDAGGDVYFVPGEQE